MLKRLFFLLFLLIKFSSSLSQDTVLVTSYNLLRFDGDIDRNIHFKKVINELSADIYITQELSNSEGVSNFLNNILNQNNENRYLSAEFFDENDIDQALFYNKNKFELLSTSSIPGDPRPILLYRLRHINTEKVFFIFNMHLKASSGSSNETRRANQINQLIDYTQQMNTDHYYIAAGDFNIYSTDEPAYRKFFEQTSTGFGKFNDIVDAEGKYNNPIYAEIHTQSPRTSQFGGGASGGLDDRFDFILFSDSLFFGNRTFFIKDSYSVLGNDGNHYNQAINTMPNSVVSQELADALHDASDHLPVSAKIIFSNEIVIPDNNPPIVSDTLFYINEVPEDNFFIGSLNAVDPDEDDLSFKILSGNENNFFKIDNEGNLRVDNGSEITYNNFQSFILIIEVSDGELSENSQVIINVIEDIPLYYEGLIPDAINIFPNPVSNELNLKTNNKNIYDFKIYNSNGKEVIRIKKLKKNQVIDFSTFNSRLYFCEFKIGSEIYRFKIIKKDL